MAWNPLDSFTTQIGGKKYRTIHYLIGDTVQYDTGLEALENAENCLPTLS